MNTRNSTKKALTHLEKELKKTIKPSRKDEKIPSSKETDAQNSLLNKFKAPKRKHLTMEYKNDSPIPEVKTSSTKLDMKYEGNSSSDLMNDKALTKEPFQPQNWQEVLKNLREMRKNLDAPVDSMGCDKYMEDNTSPQDQRYQTLISLMLSSQTRDQVNHAAMVKLRDHGCSVDNILNTDDETLGKLIYPVGFWKTKVKNIKKTSEILKNEYNGDIPNNIKDLCKLPGVGPKMAHLCMAVAWNEVTGIGVDTHVHRISNRLGWVHPQTKAPEATRKILESWLPNELWREVNHLLVGFGQQTCLPVGPKCSTCLNLQLCPFGKNNELEKSKKKRKS